MHADLWTNGASHTLKYFNYTLDEHFEQPVTVYMKCQDKWITFISQVTKKCPDFLGEYVCFARQKSFVWFIIMTNACLVLMSKI
jgi:hypothetical protein